MTVGGVNGRSARASSRRMRVGGGVSDVASRPAIFTDGGVAAGAAPVSPRPAPPPLGGVAPRVGGCGVDGIGGGKVVGLRRDAGSAATRVLALVSSPIWPEAAIGPA